MNNLAPTLNLEYNSKHSLSCTLHDKTHEDQQTAILISKPKSIAHKINFQALKNYSCHLHLSTTICLLQPA